ncbi:MAG: hypothetical protein PHT40_04520 [Patescibacteria group bacterium]|nr:hypothetical protein [Patescibacteria group bacterium]
MSRKKVKLTFGVLSLLVLTLSIYLSLTQSAWMLAPIFWGLNPLILSLVVLLVLIISFCLY